MNDEIHVVAGIFSDAEDRVLLTQIPHGKHLAGAWEFPGGKCEAGESPESALRRELHEELGVEIGDFERLISIPWRYPEKAIRLQAYRVHRYSGNPDSREGQSLRWFALDELDAIEMPAADRPIVTALRLPNFYAITPEPKDDAAFLAAIERSTTAGTKLLQLRIKHRPIDQLSKIARAVRDLKCDSGTAILLNGHIELVHELGFDGVHLSSSELMRLRIRPLDQGRWVAASCHNEREIDHAAAIGADFAVVGSVLATASHSGHAMGWTRFTELCARAPMPIYAIGGLKLSDFDRARQCGARGVAGIRSFWTNDSTAL